MNLLRWIRRKPVPHALMCDKERVVIGDGHRRWADAVDAVLALPSDAIVAVAKDGSIIRTCQRADVDDLPGEEVSQEGITTGQRELAQVAQIIADAYSVAHEHARENSARGYELLAKFAELSFGRLAAIEKAYGQLLSAHARAIEATATSSADGLDGPIGDLLGRAMGGALGGNGKATEAKGEPKA